MLGEVYLLSMSSCNDLFTLFWFLTYKGSSLFKSQSINVLIWPTTRVAWSLVALFDYWYFQLSSTLTPSAGSGGKGSPSNQEKNY